jgi:hypothetical protein
VLKHLGLIASSLLIATLVVSPASGADGHWSGAEPSGDVRAHRFDPEPPPCGTWTEPEVAEGDITRLDVRHRPGSIKVAIRLAHPTPTEGLQLTVPLRTDDAFFQVDVYERRNGQLRSDFLDVLEDPRDLDIELTTNECDNHYYGQMFGAPRCRIAATAGPRLLTVVVPRSCLDNPRWVRVGAQLGGGEDVWHYDRWAPDGVRVDEDKPWIPTYGPRVRVAR